MTNERVGGKELVQKLLRGSEALDRMKSEVNRVVRMTLGLLKVKSESYETRPSSLYPEFRPASFANHDCRWELGWESGSPKITCYVPLGYASEMVAYQIVIADWNTPAWVAQHVKEIYTGLSVFVEGMAVEFPRIKERWQYIIEAGD